MPREARRRAAALLVTRNFPPLVGGMENVNRRLLLELSRLGPVDLCGPRGCAEHAPEASRVAEAPLKPLWRFVAGTAWHALRLALRDRPSLVMAGSGLAGPMAWLAARLGGATAAVYLHGLDIIVPNRTYQALWLPFLRRCDLVLVNSANTARLAQAAGIRAERIRVLHPGTDVPEPEAGAGARFRARHELGQRRLLLSVGRLTRRKGLAEFIAGSLPALVAADPGTTLVVIGEEASDALHGASGSEKQRILATAREHGVAANLLLVGRCTPGELAEAYQAADLHVFPVLDTPGDVEGFGMVALESAAHGLRTVAFEVGGIPDAIEVPATGALVASGDYRALGACVLALLAQAPDAAQRADCLRFARGKDWEHFGERLRAIVREAVPGDENLRQPHVVKDLPSRRWKAEKIARLLQLGESGPPLRILEVGTGSGGIGHYFGTHPSGRYQVESVDVVDERLVHEGYSFSLVTDAGLPFEDASFDLAISNHVIEHVGLESEQRRHLAELRRVLKPQGRGYLAVPNRWMLVEPHYKLAFLSWLPRALRTPWLRAWGKGEFYDCEPLQMRQLEGYLRDSGLEASNRSVDALRATLEIEHPQALATRLQRRLPDRLLSAFRRLIPTHIYTFAPDGRPARMAADGDDPARLACITVTFGPDIDMLRRQLGQLPAPALKVLVDNGSPHSGLAALRALAAETGCLLVENGANLGLARALNLGAGAARAARPGLAMLLLLDQDSEPGNGNVEALLAAWARLRSIDPALGCIGPALTDAGTGAVHGFHRIAGWRWAQVLPAGTEPVRVDNLNGSGTLVPAELFDRLGGLAAELFIDHVDTDWAFRVAAAGYTLYGIPGVRFLHRMGERGIRFWCFGWRVWPHRSPKRHFTLFRNTVRLLRASGVPRVWKAWAMVKLALSFALYLAFDRERAEQAGNMLRGLRAGLRPWDRTAR